VRRPDLPRLKGKEIQPQGRKPALYCGGLTDWGALGAVQRRWLLAAVIVIAPRRAGRRVRRRLECAETKANGAYEIEGLDEGPYRVEFTTGKSGLGLATQYWKGAASTAKATSVWVNEGHASTGIDAVMTAASTVAAAGGTEFGDPCEFVAIEAGAAGFEFKREGSPLPAAAPVSGVLTRWSVTTPAGIPSELAPLDVRVVDVVGPATAEVVAKSAIETLAPWKKNTFETRLPIAAGDHLALGSNSSPIPRCGGNPNVERTSTGYFEAPVAGPGAKQEFFLGEYGVPVVGVIEPDGDEDGYGDESQDGCPQSAAFHAACPTVSFSPGYSVGPRSIRVKVKSSAATPVSVTGASPGPGILSAVERISGAGTPSAVSVPIPRALAARLHRLGPRQALHVRLRAHAAKVDGLPSTDHLWVRLPGRG
jgi:hypothetical protein